MSHELTWEPNGVYWKYADHVTGDEIIETSSSIYGDSRFDNLQYKLVNFLNVKSIDMDETQVMLIASQHKAAAISNPNVKNAIVANAKLNHLINTFVSFLADSEWEVKVFDDLDKANEWLERKEDN